MSQNKLRANLRQQVLRRAAKEKRRQGPFFEVENKDLNQIRAQKPLLVSAKLYIL